MSSCVSFSRQHAFAKETIERKFKNRKIEYDEAVIMRGANPVTAIDIDDWCVNNSKDNIALNHIHNITVELGDANLLKGRKAFDVIIANINRNILLADLPHYAACMHPGSEIFMSGFYIQDIPFIREKAESLGMKFVHHREKNNWAAVKFIMK